MHSSRYATQPVSPSDELPQAASKHLVREAIRAQHPHADEIELSRLFLHRFYGDELTAAVIDAVARAVPRPPA